ncbi:unnamed protein product [Acanthoscelides obtectus]|uniref:Uncharacterized protein n=1 Tax=Acanthoscelides obtectus TaxID=200917 RepID=A0A9P0Q8L3_ACAOB|nr:unnamed protein product [Acanthoscelides obtectus]CAK1685281.1 hypothetical protein AOBTE_LOCUS35301 [Acanthoscelides obtectus]
MFCPRKSIFFVVRRSGRDTYRDEAIGYVQLKRERDICFVKARITPEHRVKSKQHHGSFECDEKEEKAAKLEWSGCAAQGGGCKHCGALLMWLHRRSEEPSCTSVKCYWTNARLSTTVI